MKKRFLLLPLFMAVLACQALGGETIISQEKNEDGSQQLKEENAALRAEIANLKDELGSKLDAAEVERMIREITGEEAKSDPAEGEFDIREFLDRSFSYSGPMAEETGYIKKGDMTGGLDKLLNINLFLAGRSSWVQNDGINSNPVGPAAPFLPFPVNDNDEITLPGARIYLTGQVVEQVTYKVAYEFSNENDLGAMDRNGRLTDAMVTWRLPVETDLMGRLEFNAGLGPVFLSPAGQEDIFFLDTIEHPLIVQNLLPPGTARDKGFYVKGNFLTDDRVQLWAGVYNGAHRALRNDMTTVSNPYDAWGNMGTDTDQYNYMGRMQVNVLDQDDYFWMVSGGVSRNSAVAFNMVSGGVHRVDDVLFDVATKFLFNEKKTWLKAELIRTRTKHCDDQVGYHVTAGHRLSFLSEGLEAIARYEVLELLDSRSSLFDDLCWKTIGLNYYFDPENVNDGKLQLNYIFRDEAHTDMNWGAKHYSNDALLLQFVIGF